jgi:hypothetical protein
MSECNLPRIMLIPIIGLVGLLVLSGLEFLTNHPNRE